ncbi:hypothetical protein Pmani_011771 [Petrolisthes manimaculis]|uniref:HTH OST-type domain-containing protein n=1 Tax=Petrolisthes manimaculis TaxID=1843537 RepID=A0AAE1Q1V8_9EUCA|nr:hypothetical protein Pmani_011771 [Petrolisthes manimaculis]
MCSRNKQVILFPPSDFSEVNGKMTAPAIPVNVAATFLAILRENCNTTPADLVFKWEKRTGKKILLTEYGFSSIPELLSAISAIIDIYKEGEKGSKDDFVTTNHEFSGSSNSLLTEECKDGGFSVESESTATLSSAVAIKLKKLVEKEFPGGLCIYELLGAYRGMYGAALDDLAPDKYQHSCLESLLKSVPDLVKLHYGQGNILVLATQTVNPQLEIAFGALRNNEKGYKKQDASTLFPCDALVEVVLGEVYSPYHFWIIHHGSSTSQQLNFLMDNMFEFYSSRVGERYMVPQEVVAVGALVVAQYTDDNNYYRAIITVIEDLTTVKASLDNVIPMNGKKKWNKHASVKFLEMVQNKGLIAQVISTEDVVHLCLWDTNGEVDVNIGEFLIEEGFAARSLSGPARFLTNDTKKTLHHHENKDPSYQEKNEGMAMGGLGLCDDESFTKVIFREAAMREAPDTSTATQAYSVDHIDVPNVHDGGYLNQIFTRVNNDSCPDTSHLNHDLQSLQNINCTVNEPPSNFYQRQVKHCSIETVDTVSSNLDSKVADIFTEFRAVLIKIKEHIPDLLDTFLSSPSLSCKSNEGNFPVGRQTESATPLQSEDSHWSPDQYFAMNNSVGNVSDITLEELTKRDDEDTVSEPVLGNIRTKIEENNLSGPSSHCPLIQSQSTKQAVVTSVAHYPSMHDGNRTEEPVKDKDVIYYSDKSEEEELALPSAQYHTPSSSTQYHAPSSLMLYHAPSTSTECDSPFLTTQYPVSTLSCFPYNQTPFSKPQHQPPTQGQSEVHPIALTPNTRLHVVWKDGIPFVLSAEITHLLCLSRDLESSLIHKGIRLPSTVMTLDDDAEIFLQLVK